MWTKQLAYCVLSILTTVSQAPRADADTGAKSVYAVVVSKNFPVDDIPFVELKRLYMGDRVDTGGKRLIPLALQNRLAERSDFDEVVLGMSPDAVARYWVDRKIRGESGPPKSVDSAQILLRVVDKLDGAIGYVKANEVSASVKVLRIDGKRPTDSGYRLTR
jgi:hypothetical protein